MGCRAAAAQDMDQGEVMKVIDLQNGLVHDLGTLTRDGLEGLKVTEAPEAVNPVVGQFLNWPAMLLDLQATTEQLKAANPGTWLCLRPDWNNLLH